VSESVLNHPLLSHPEHPSPPGLALAVARLAPDPADPGRPLRLVFTLRGPTTAIRWPEPLAPGAARRADGLWRHTCFEAFATAPGAAGAASGPYLEFNFAPSGAWAAYRFDGYRAGMRNEPLPLEPRVTIHDRDGERRIEIACPWPAPLAGGAHEGAESGGGADRGMGPRAQASRIRLGLSAVLEAADGSLSYWALRHPPGRPDFHNAAGFQLEVAG